MRACVSGCVCVSMCPGMSVNVCMLLMLDGSRLCLFVPPGRTVTIDDDHPPPSPLSLFLCVCVCPCTGSWSASKADQSKKQAVSSAAPSDLRELHSTVCVCKQLQVDCKYVSMSAKVTRGRCKGTCTWNMKLAMKSCCDCFSTAHTLLLYRLTSYCLFLSRCCPHTHFTFIQS